MKTRLKFLILAAVIIFSCQNSDKGITSKRNNTSISHEYNKGEYGYDLEFLKKHLNPLELVNRDSRLVIEPEYQGRVMTSSSSGLKGFSYGWINYDLIGSSTIREHINPYGGEERIWLETEAGQFSIFFKKGTPFNLENWFVPAVFDQEPFEVANKDDKSITLLSFFLLTVSSEAKSAFHSKGQFQL